MIKAQISVYIMCLNLGYQYWYLFKSQEVGETSGSVEDCQTGMHRGGPIQPWPWCVLEQVCIVTSELATVKNTYKCPSDSITRKYSVYIYVASEVAVIRKSQHNDL